MELPKRKQNRLPEYDYELSGAYFITICTANRERILWENVGANCVRPHTLFATGELVKQEIEKWAKIYDNVKIDKYVIMPNHLHLIISINADGRTQFAPTISRMVKQFKGSITKRLGRSIFQRSFYDHIIRNEQDHRNIWEYIDNNPIKWEEDIYY